MTPARHVAARNSGNVLFPAWSVRNAAIRASRSNGGTSTVPDAKGVPWVTTGPCSVRYSRKKPQIACHARTPQRLRQIREATDLGPDSHRLLLGGLQIINGLTHRILLIRESRKSTHVSGRCCPPKSGHLWHLRRHKDRTDSHALHLRVEAGDIGKNRAHLFA